MNVDYILNNKEKYKQMLRDRFKDPYVIEKLANIRQEYVGHLQELENLNKCHNNCSKLFSTIKKTNFVTDEIKEILDNLFEDSLIQFDYSDLDLLYAMLKNKINKVQTQKTKVTKNVEKSFANLKACANEIPNLLAHDVPIFSSEDNNLVIYQTDICTAKKYGQYELCLKTGIYESATEISGNRAYFLVNDGIKLNTALLMYAQDFLRTRGFKVMQTPFFMNQGAMQTVCQLAEFDDTLYKVKDGSEEDKYLIATSEQPLTAYFENKQLDNLPVKISGISSCFRKEAGKHGVDTNGIFRVHQFEKVEQFCVTDEESSYEMMEQMLQNAQDFYNSLGIQYRVVSIVSGALNNAASKKYDIEGWFAGSGKFRELVSCSNTTDYFSKRLRCKNGKNKLCHMLNSTLYANTRTICCLLEMGQTESGIQIPDVLVPYFGKNTIEYVK